MAKTYSVWIEIEEHDDETGEYETLDAPGAAVESFETYDEAWAFAEKLTDAIRNLETLIQGEQR